MSDCRHDIDKLRALAEGRLSERAASKVRQRIDSCESCASKLKRLEAIRASLRDIADLEPPDDINYRLVEAQVNWQLSQDERGETKRASDRRGGLALRPALVFGTLVLLAGIAIGALMQYRGGAGLALTGVAYVDKAAKPSKAPAAATASKAAAQPFDGALAALPTVLGGDVRVIDYHGKSHVLQLTRPVLPGETLVTGKDGRVSLQWGGGSGVRVEPSSRVTFAELTYNIQALRLGYGGVELEIAKRRADQHVAVVAGPLRSEVHGTRFLVRRDEARAELHVVRGVVRASPTGRAWTSLEQGSVANKGDVTNRGGHKHQLTNNAVDVTAGYVLKVDGDGPPTLSRRVDKNDKQLSLNLLDWQSLAAALASSGTLAVLTRPIGADLTLDSVHVGPSNLRLRLRIGRHLVGVWRDGKLLHKRWVEIGSGPSKLELALRAQEKPLPPPIVSMLRRRAPQLRGCYERRLKVAQSLKGKLRIKLSVDDSGAVEDASVLRDTLDDKRVGMCVVNVIKRWHFANKKALTVVFPLVFRPM
ncbi:MAG: AgmX/PglI C-terminal domain-containing protein [Myxococcales bacterium]|nr:AgmX/PglI C-terminal domain-containing protein [Myxococcales bacterium]